MLIAAYCLDADNMLETRMDVRPAHLEFLKGLGTRLKLAGPMLDEQGEKPVGSLVIIEADSLSHADQLLAGDPYQAAKLFKSIDLRPWRGVTGEWWENA